MKTRYLQRFVSDGRLFSPMYSKSPLYYINITTILPIYIPYSYILLYFILDILDKYSK